MVEPLIKELGCSYCTKNSSIKLLQRTLGIRQYYNETHSNKAAPQTKGS